MDGYIRFIGSTNYSREWRYYQPVHCGCYKLATLTRLKNACIKDTKFNLEGYLRNEFAERFGRAEEDAFINGDGLEMPTGVLYDTKGATVSVTTTAITYEDVLWLYFSLDKHNRKKAVG